MGTTREILGSDDEDFEDDVSNEYRESMPRSQSSAAIAARQRSASEASGENVIEPIHINPAEPFGDSHHLSITDETSHIDAENLPVSNPLKRSQTTMEQLGSGMSRYSNKRSIFTRPGFSIHADKDISTPAKGRAKSANAQTMPPEPFALSQLKQTQGSNFEMPSSRETHAAGSKALVGEESSEEFKTQSTVPFTNVNTQTITQVLPPAVVIPPSSHRAVETETGSQLRSSAAVLADIDAIDNFLQKDIAAARAAQELPGALESGSNSISLDNTQVLSLSDGQTVDPKSLLLRQDPQFASQSSEPGQEIESSAMRPEKPDGNTVKSKQAKAEVIDPDEMDETGLPPPDLYKPRPSKRRATADLSALQNPTTLSSDGRSKPSKRRKTANDLETTYETLREDEEQPVAPKKEKKAKKKHVDTEYTQGDRTSTLDITEPETHVRAVGTDSIRQGTVELGDIINESAEQPPEPAPKKKRGRPKKENNRKSAPREEVEAPVPEWLVDEEDKKDTKRTKTRGTRGSTRKSSTRIIDDSEDELAGDGHATDGVKPSPDWTHKENEENGVYQDEAAPSEGLDDEDEDDRPPKAPTKRGVKPKASKPTPPDPAEHTEDPKPKKRGHKPKKKPTPPPELASDDELADQPVADVDGAEQASEPVPSARTPLKELPTAINSQSPSKQNSAATENEADNAAVLDKPQPETPMADKPASLAKGTPMGVSSSGSASGNVAYRVGLSRRMRVAPLLRSLKR